MIFGIGTDCVRIERIRKLLNQFDEKAIKRIFTETEIKRAEKSTCEENKIRTFAKRFAAKEDFSKALGTGIGVVEFCDIEVDNSETGAPFLKISPKAMKIVLKKTGGKEPTFHLSLSDEKEIAIAFVIIEI